MVLTPQPLDLTITPYYTKPEIEWVQQPGFTDDTGGGWTLNHKAGLPRASQWRIIKETHDSTHLGRGDLVDRFSGRWRKSSTRCLEESNSPGGHCSRAPSPRLLETSFRRCG